MNHNCRLISAILNNAINVSFIAGKALRRYRIIIFFGLDPQNPFLTNRFCNAVQIAGQNVLAAAELLSCYFSHFFVCLIRLATAGNRHILINTDLSYPFTLSYKVFTVYNRLIITLTLRLMVIIIKYRLIESADIAILNKYRSARSIIYDDWIEWITI